MAPDQELVATQGVVREPPAVRARVLGAELARPLARAVEQARRRDLAREPGLEKVPAPENQWDLEAGPETAAVRDRVVAPDQELAIRTASTACPEQLGPLLNQYTPLLQASPPSLMARAASLARATAKWLVAGRPLREASDVARIYDEVCAPCEHRENTTDPEISWCCKCGCRLSRTDRVFHKIMLVTEHCPLGKW